MALNTWWEHDDAERYWMEVATTGSIGGGLIAPKLPGGQWSYELVSQVREGDRVLHWQSAGDVRGLVGWSVATNDPEVVSGYSWQPRGTSGRALAGPRTTDAWFVPLGGLNRFDQPLTATDLQGWSNEILALRASLERSHGKPTYFPFYLYGQQQLRAQQGYLLKFPVELFDVLPDIDAAAVQEEESTPEELTEDAERQRQAVPRGRTTLVQDSMLRSALENHAVERAIELYQQVGGSDFVKLGKPYDIRLLLAGIERHVEVKGSSLLIETVELTRNEVTHARTYQNADLVVVDGIEWSRVDGGIATTGGRLRVWLDWVPHDRDLSARKFAYDLPPGGQPSELPNQATSAVEQAG